MKIKLPSNATADQKVTAIEDVIQDYVTKKGTFNAAMFAKDFHDIQGAIQSIPDWQVALKDNPLFSDDELSEAFLNLITEVNPSTTALAAFAKEFQYEFAGLIKEFSSVPMETGIPPLNQELIVWHPGLMASLYAICTYADGSICTFKNLGIGGDFSVSTANVKWLPAKRFEDVKVPSVVSADIRSFSKSGSRVRTFTKKH